MAVGAKRDLSYIARVLSATAELQDALYSGFDVKIDRARRALDLLLAGPERERTKEAERRGWKGPKLHGDVT